MFPEHRELITRLKTQDARFLSLFDKHNALDQRIVKMESHLEPGTPIEIENLKKLKLALKDDIYKILLKHAK